jgi:alcohol dehydrogenase
VLKPGGKLIGIAGPPDPDFAKELGASWFLKTAMRFLSYRIRKAAKRHGVSYSFVFMRADGGQLSQIATLIDTAAIRPVIDRVFPFESTKEAMAYVETGRAKGKVVIKIR